jgi:hypothetical protein
MKIIFVKINQNASEKFGGAENGYNLISASSKWP